MNSAFLRDFRELAQTTTRGCIVLERPDLLKKLVEKHDARDATGSWDGRSPSWSERWRRIGRRSTLPARSCEKSWLYRFAKHYWFDDFGVYNPPCPSTASIRPRGSRAEPGSRPRRHRSMPIPACKAGSVSPAQPQVAVATDVGPERDVHPDVTMNVPFGGRIDNTTVFQGALG